MFNNTAGAMDVEDTGSGNNTITHVAYPGSPQSTSCTFASYLLHAHNDGLFSFFLDFPQLHIY